MAGFHVGTCSWKYPSWEGLVYSRRAGINYLREYAQKYETVEVDQWFWSLFPGKPVVLPAMKDVCEYRESVPQSFRFSVKAPNSLTLTHAYSRDKKDDLKPNSHFLSVKILEKFLASLDPLGETLGPVIFQFEYLNRQKMVSQKNFEEALGVFFSAAPKGPRYAVEIRNANYWNERFLAFLAQHRIIPVLLEGYWMPPVAELAKTLATSISAFPALILRLHGKDREGMERDTEKEWNRIIRPLDDELSGIAGLVRSWLKEGKEIYLNINNHYEGSAPLTIQRFLEFFSADAYR